MCTGFSNQLYALCLGMCQKVLNLEMPASVYPGSEDGPWWQFELPVSRGAAVMLSATWWWQNLSLCNPDTLSRAAFQNGTA